MQMLARGYLIYDITGSASILGYIHLGMAVPMLTVPLFGGVIADRFSRKTIIQCAQIALAGQTLVLGLLIHFNLIIWQYVLVESLINGCAWSFLMPARQAIIPQLISQQNISNALALNAAAHAFCMAAAPAIAGVLYAYVGPWNVYYIVVILGLLSVILTALIPRVESMPSPDNSSVLREMLEGLNYIRSMPILVVLLLLGLATTMLAMPFKFILPVFVIDVYRQGPDSMGALMALLGVGSTVGALYAAATGRGRRGITLIVASFLSGISLLLIAGLPYYSAALVIMLLMGLGDAGRLALNQTLLIEVSSDRYRGRVMSVFMLNYGLMPLSILPAGMLTDYFGGQFVVTVMGTALIAIMCVVLFTQGRLRNMA